MRGLVASVVCGLFLLAAPCALAQVVAGKSPDQRTAVFESAAHPLGALQARRARERGEQPRPTSGDRIQGILYKPDGDGPFPAVVLLPRCDGFTPFIRNQLPEILSSWGYLVLAVDGLTSRAVSDPCNDTKVDTLADAYGALLYLATQPFVDKQRVGVLGIASGGRVALTVADPQVQEVLVNPNKLDFRSIVAFYPQCGNAGDSVSTPALILIGQEDQWARPASCEEYARAHGGSRPIEIALFPGVQHGFLEPEYMAGYNQPAAEAALRKTHDFLARTLAPERR